MKTRLTILCVAAMAASAHGDEIKTSDGVIHRGEISHVDPDGIVMMTDSGTEKVPLAKVSPELQQKYHFDAAKAAAFAAANARKQQAIASQASDATETAEMQRGAILEKARQLAVQPTPSATPWVPSHSPLDDAAKPVHFGVANDGMTEYRRARHHWLPERGEHLRVQSEHLKRPDHPLHQEYSNHPDHLLHPEHPEHPDKPQAPTGDALVSGSSN